MKKIIVVIGVLIAIASAYTLLQHVLNYNELSNYGKGYIWGKVAMLFIGIGLIFFGIRMKKNRS